VEPCIRRTFNASDQQQREFISTTLGLTILILVHFTDEAGGLAFRPMGWLSSLVAMEVFGDNTDDKSDMFMTLWSEPDELLEDVAKGTSTVRSEV
jgi:hypothetical protein